MTGETLGLQVVRKEIQQATLKLVPIGDLHKGNVHFNESLCEGLLDYIQSSGAYTIGMGDYLEFALPVGHGTLEGATWEQVIQPKNQIDWLVERLRPIRKRVLALIDGNHEARMWKKTGISPTAMVCSALDIPYLGPSGFVELLVQKQRYVVYALHGASCAAFPYTKLAGMMKQLYGFGADLYLMGHVHEVAAISEDYFYVEGDEVHRRKRYFVLTGHTLHYGGYVQRGAKLPGKQGAAKITLYGDRWDIHVSA